jgi:hypothetical protein
MTKEKVEIKEEINEEKGRKKIGTNERKRRKGHREASNKDTACLHVS